jgi:hypothetical protein
MALSEQGLSCLARVMLATGGQTPSPGWQVALDAVSCGKSQGCAVLGRHGAARAAPGRMCGSGRLGELARTGQRETQSGCP